MAHYRKPNGKTTESGQAYCLAWRREINLPLEKHYDLTVMAFDPDVLVKARGTDSRPASIPLWLAKRMIAVAKAAADVPKTGTIIPKLGTPLGQQVLEALRAVDKRKRAGLPAVQLEGRA